MKLTIGMIVKNEEEYLERCLNGLKPILDNVDSELIIADTGSEDDTVEIAKRFTDNVYHFEWINDFAAARNSTLEKAKGEWYMFVDGDEVFTSCNEIIRFFNSGDYKKYTSASFVIRNIMSPTCDGKDLTYDCFNAPRLTRIQAGTRFVGAVHETLNSFYPPYMILNDSADHFGYLYKSREELQEKMRRNSELLLKELEAKGDDASPMQYLRIYESYVNVEPEKGFVYLEKGIAKAKKEASTVLIAMYCDKARYELAHSNFEWALATCDDYFGMDEKVRPYPLRADAEICAIRAIAYFSLSNYEKAIESFIIFFDIYRKVKSGHLNTFDSFMTTYVIANERNFINILKNFLIACINSDKYEIAYEYLRDLPIYKFCDADGDTSDIVPLIVDVLYQYDYKNTQKYYTNLDKSGKRKMKEILLKDLFIGEKTDSIIAELNSLAGDDAAFKAKIDILDKYFCGETIPQTELFDFAEKYTINEHPEIMYIAVKQKNDITGIIEIPGFDMKLTVYRCYMNVYGFAAAMEEYPASAVKNADRLPGAIRFLNLCMQTVPIYKSPKPGEDVRISVENLFDIYAELGARYIREHSTELSKLPDDIRVAVTAGDIVTARKSKHYIECFSAMKKAIEEYPPFSVVIGQYRKIVENEYEISSGNKQQSEMIRLCGMIKGNIRKYIESGELAAAKKTLVEYTRINPHDDEINELSEMIEKQER